MLTISRRIEFDAAHRVRGHEGACRFIHGHRYAAEVTVRAPGLDSLGRVIDFGEVKRLVGSWVLREWDHNLLLSRGDQALLDAIRHLGEREPYLFAGNPTAENIARELYFVAFNLLPRTLEVAGVRVYETPSCWADYFPDSGTDCGNVGEEIHARTDSQTG